MTRALARLPVWAWLLGLVALSTVVRFAFARRMPAPWIFVDELIYSELAKSLAARGELEILGAPAGGAYGLVYPALLAPAFALFDSVPSAYLAAKGINALVVSLAAVPAYLLARRVLAVPLALTAAALSLALPSLLYAGTLMTENAFYPMFLVAVLALVLAVERPTPGRVLAFLAAAALAFATRAQALVLGPALVTAPLLVVALRREPLRALAAYRWLYGIPLALFAALLAVQGLRGRSPLDLLGAYRVAGEERYDVTEVGRWLLFHLAGLDLSVGVLPFAAFLLLLLVAPRLRPRDQVFLATAAALSGWLLLQVSAFASRHALRVEERNMFYLAPLFLIALLLWIERGLPRPRVPTAVAVGAAGVLPAALPFATLVGVSAVSDSFFLLPWWTVHEWGIPLEGLRLAAAAFALALGLALAFVPRGRALVLPGLVLAFFLASHQPVETRTQAASIGALFQGITRPERDWVDRAVGERGAVAVVYSPGAPDDQIVIQNRFFSRSIGPVYTVGASLRGGGLPQTALTVDEETGVLLDPDGEEVRSPYALVHDSLPLAGELHDRDETKGVSVLALEGPLRLQSGLEGVWADGWTGPEATYVRYGCDGGTAVFTLESDPALFDGPQIVRASVAGVVVRRGTIPRVGEGRLVVPLRAEGGRCEVLLSIAPTAVPGGGDERRLGTHVREVEVRP